MKPEFWYETKNVNQFTILRNAIVSRNSSPIAIKLNRYFLIPRFWPFCESRTMSSGDGDRKSKGLISWGIKPILWVTLQTAILPFRFLHNTCPSGDGFFMGSISSASNMLKICFSRQKVTDWMYIMLDMKILISVAV